MNASIRLAVLAGMLLSLPFLGFGQKYSNEFLSIGVGARAQAMGNSVIASVNDVTAGVWNPAGLAAIGPDQGLQIGAMHAEWFGGVSNFDYLGLSLPLTNSEKRIAISMVRLGIDGIPNTLSLYDDDGTIRYENITEFSAADYGFFLTYATPIRTKFGTLYAGGNIKIVHRRIGPFATSWGFGADIGVQLPLKNWRFGILAKDITTTFNAWSFDFTDEEKEVLELTNNEVPISSVEITNPQVVLGAGYRFQVKKAGIYPEVNFVVTTDGQRNTLISADPFSIDPSFGLELDYNQFVYLRAGVSQFQEEIDFDGETSLRVRPSMGVGLKIASLKVDYAYTDLGSDENTFSHIISLLLQIKPRKK